MISHMKRMTISLIATAAIVVVGTFVIWTLFTAPRPEGPAVEPPTTEPPPTTQPETPPLAFDAALNLYLAAPARLPAGAGRVELKLTEAAFVRADGTEAVFFDGSRKVVLQDGVVEKAMSEKIPVGHWSRLKLTFSPAADLSYADGRPDAAALVERREAILAFDAEVTASRTLALFVRAPLEARAGAAEGLVTLDFSAQPASAESYVFGAYLLDARGRGDIWNIADPSLAAAVQADLGFDITRQLSGSSGFVPAPSPAP
jgi:hypothetical protein